MPVQVRLRAPICKTTTLRDHLIDAAFLCLAIAYHLFFLMLAIHLHLLVMEERGQ